MIERVLTDRLGGADRPAVFPGPLLLAVVALSACGGASAGEAGGMTATAEIPHGHKVAFRRILISEF